MSDSSDFEDISSYLREPWTILGTDLRLLSESSDYDLSRCLSENVIIHDFSNSTDANDASSHGPSVTDKNAVSEEALPPSISNMPRDDSKSPQSHTATTMNGSLDSTNTPSVPLEAPPQLDAEQTTLMASAVEDHDLTASSAPDPTSGIINLSKETSLECFIGAGDSFEVNSSRYCMDSPNSALSSSACSKASIASTGRSGVFGNTPPPLPPRFHAWNESKFRALTTPKPVPKSVIETSAYNLR